MDMYKLMMRTLIRGSIEYVLEDNDFIVKAITKLYVKDDSHDNKPSLHFEYEVFAYDMAYDSEKVTITGCGYVSETGVHAVRGAWSVTEGWC